MIYASCAGGRPTFTSQERPALLMSSTAALDRSSATRTLMSDMRLLFPFSPPQGAQVLVHDGGQIHGFSAAGFRPESSPQPHGAPRSPSRFGAAWIMLRAPH